ncbi:MAG: ATP-dependent 6-phosphofructokinase [Candidatus Poribacteria bacterium]|nr:ATP-dependent 6-phosphofructokinase [Candidatus Poribacteria bacterium]
MRIAVNTGGGDAPGLNAVIRAVVHAAESRGWNVYGVNEGYNGFLRPGGVHPLTTEMVRGITALGGTILGTVNTGSPFDFPRNGERVDISDEIVNKFYENKFDAFVAIGGDGSFRIAKQFMDKGLPMVCVPKTIDNDVNATHVTFGFQTAVNTATDALDKLHSHAESHRRIMCVEVMGRYCGWIALHSGVAATADIILLPEIPFDLDIVAKAAERRYKTGRNFAIAVVAEGAHPKDGEMTMLLDKQELGREQRLGGIAEKVAAMIAAKTGRETRSLTLGHLLRGGHPTAYDRALALQYGAAAVRAIEQRAFGTMVSYDPPDMVFRPVSEGIDQTKYVPLDGELIQCARDMGICLGD